MFLRKKREEKKMFDNISLDDSNNDSNDDSKSSSEYMKITSIKKNEKNENKEEKDDKNDYKLQNYQNILTYNININNLTTEFPYFKNYDIQSILLHIYSYLNSNDLCKLSCTSKSFYISTMSPKLWKSLLLLDFMFDDNEIKLIKETPDNIIPPSTKNISLHSISCSASKSYYLKHLKVVNERINNAKITKLQLEKDRILEEKVKYVEYFLDFTSIRFYLPLPAAMIFSTLIMIGLKVDGKSLSIWVCLSPILFFCFYTIILSLITYITYKYRHNQSSLIRLLWTNLRGPIQFFYTQVANETSAPCYMMLSVCFLSLIQILFFGFKVSKSFDHSFHEDFSWEIVFLPIWLLFIVYLGIPFLGCARGGLAPFFAFLLLIWLPLLILFICLAIKLNGIEDHTHDKHIKISLMLIPFWIIEGIIMIAGFIGLVNGLHRYRKGFLDRDNLNERIGIYLFRILFVFFL